MFTTVLILDCDQLQDRVISKAYLQLCRLTPRAACGEYSPRNIIIGVLLLAVSPELFLITEHKVGEENTWVG